MSDGITETQTTPLKSIIQPTLVFGTIIRDIAVERDRQEALRESGKFLWTCASPDAPIAEKNAVLGEEYGEVCRAVVEIIIARDKDNAGIKASTDEDLRAALTHLRRELIETAAVCVAWCEALDATLAE
jgi:hypothetical protein